MGSSSDVSLEDSSDDEVKPPVKSLTSSPSKKAINSKVNRVTDSLVCLLLSKEDVCVYEAFLYHMGMVTI